MAHLLKSLKIPYPTTAVHIGRRFGALPTLIDDHTAAVKSLESVLTNYLKNPNKLPKRPIRRVNGTRVVSQVFWPRCCIDTRVCRTPLIISPPKFVCSRTRLRKRDTTLENESPRTLASPRSLERHMLKSSLGTFSTRARMSLILPLF